MPAPVASGESESPGGPCTHWKAPPCHGARGLRSFLRHPSLAQAGEIRRLNQSLNLGHAPVVVRPGVTGGLQMGQAQIPLVAAQSPGLRELRDRSFMLSLEGVRGSEKRARSREARM